MSEATATDELLSLATDLADALYLCQEARLEEAKARGEANVPDSWDYFGRGYFDEIARADGRLAAVLARLTAS